MSYIPGPDHAPFHVEPDGYRVWEMANGRFLVSGLGGNTYQGDLKGVARFIERERHAS